MWMWISYVDLDLPIGSKSIGVAIMNGKDTQDVINNSPTVYATNLDIMSVEIPEKYVVLLDDKYKNKLLPPEIAKVVADELDSIAASLA